MTGTTFELDSRYNRAALEEEIDGMFWNEDTDDLDVYKNPCTTSFKEWKAEMEEVLPGVHKKVVKQAAEGTKEIDLSRTRVTYHRNLYGEGDLHPFDSTYLNGSNSNEICLPLKNGGYLEGFLEALGTMKEGEQSLFIICYQKMFKELGCQPRVSLIFVQHFKRFNPRTASFQIKEKADILCDILILKVEEVGDQEAIDNLINGTSEAQKLADIKKDVEETRIRAVDYFATKNYDKAIRLYQRILQIVQFAKTSSEAEVEERNKILIQIHTNLAVCLNKKEQWEETINHVRQIEEFIKIDDMPKVLYAKGVALMKLGENDQALAALVKAQKLKPLDNQIIKALEELKERKNAYDGFIKNFSKNLKLA